MQKKYRVLLGVLFTAGVVALAGWYLSRHTIAVLHPAGEVGYKERDLIVLCAALSLAIVVPVFALLGYITWKYREGNKKAHYAPDLGGSKLAETIWWVVPAFLMVIISIITWQTSYALDPFKPLVSDKQAVRIQVVSLDWKWLFIYPDEHIASINEVAVPVDTPVTFELTSDSVMTSFWAPQLAGQMYTMPGMSTKLNIKAAKVGGYRGVAANVSGKGFAGMNFTVRALPVAGYDAWLTSARRSPDILNSATYAALSKQSENVPVRYYSKVNSGLYDTIVMKYMMHMPSDTNTEVPRPTTHSQSAETDMSGMEM